MSGPDGRAGDVTGAPTGGERGWSAFLAGYHERHAAVTEELLAPMRGPGGLDPYAWLVEGLPPTGPVWDLCCGSAPVADVVGHDRYAGVDLSAAELAEAARRRPGARVVRGDALATDPPDPPAAVVVAMALMLLPLGPALDRVAELLPPGAPFHALVPTREDAAGTGYGVLLDLLGLQGQGYRQPLAPAVVAGALAAAGLRLLDDEVAVFRRPVAPEDVDLVAGSFYLRDADPAGAGAAARWLHERPTGWLLDYPLRRLRAVRT